MSAGPEEPVAERAGRTEVDGRALAWRRLGSEEQPPLLLLNGYAAGCADWDPGFLGALADRFDLVCPDPRGAGRSELGAEELTIEGLAADAAAVLDALGWDRAAVAGWSMGGFAAQELTATAPDRVSALALISTDPGAEAVRAPAEVWSRLTDHGGTPREQAKRLLELLFPPRLAASVFEQFGDVVAEARAGLDPRALSAQERAMDAWHARPGAARLAAISAPTLIAAGDGDVVIPAANVELIRGGIAGAEAVTFPGCGHAVMAQEPARLAERIGDLAGAQAS